MQFQYQQTEILLHSNPKLRFTSSLKRMITSSNFFNKSMFNTQDEVERDTSELGPWQVSKQRKFATLDIDRKINNKSENRYQKHKYSQPSLLYSRRMDMNLIAHSYNLQLQRQSSYINKKLSKLKQRTKNQTFLPQIQTMRSQKVQKMQLSPSSNSPLAYELNFITKKQQKKSRKRKYLSDYIDRSQQSQPKLQKKSYLNYDPVQKYLQFQNQSKYNIYEGCVIEVKRNTVKSQEL